MIEIKRATIVVSEKLKLLGISPVSIVFGDEDRDGEVMITPTVSVLVLRTGGVMVVARSGSGRTEWPIRHVVMEGYTQLQQDIQQALR